MGYWTLVAVTLLLAVARCFSEEVTIYKKPGGAYSYEFGKLDKGGAAYATFNATLLETGWGVLNIKGGYGAPLKDTEIAHSIGYAEGLLTAKEIWQHYQNMNNYWFAGRDPALRGKVLDFLKEQMRWMKAMIDKHANNDPLWRHAGFIYEQFQGLYQGYKEVASKYDWDIDISIPMVLNGVGDLIDLMHAVDPSSLPNFDSMTREELMQFHLKNSHCSALVKVMPAFEDLFMAHSSWFSYSATNRIYKHYDFNIKDKATAAHRSSFSSYPGFLESLDDFYLLSSNMVMLQTTNNVFNKELYKKVKPQSLLAWQRVRMANMMAHSGKEWSDVLSQYNSGTYNNQYMVIDLKKVSLNKELKDDALWVVEQIPTLVVGADQTNVLRTGYWPSYNVPYYEQIYNMSGYPAMVEKHGPTESYQLAPRAKIFRRDQAKVKDMKSFQDIMRYNDYKEDPYSDNNSCDTICCRGDLLKNPNPSGCYDTKVTDFKMALGMTSLAINGPTRSSGLLPFSWTGPFKNNTHIGLPETYKFDWVTMKPAFN